MKVYRWRAGLVLALALTPVLASAQTRLCVSQGNGTCQSVDSSNPLPVAPDGVPNTALTSTWDGTAKAATGYNTVLVSFSGISGGDSYVVQGTLAGTTFWTLSCVNLGDYSTAASFTADGLYSCPATASVKYVKTGTASTPTVNLLLKR